MYTRVRTRARNVFTCGNLLFITAAKRKHSLWREAAATKKEGRPPPNSEGTPRKLTAAQPPKAGLGGHDQLHAYYNQDWPFCQQINGKGFQKSIKRADTLPNFITEAMADTTDSS